MRAEPDPRRLELPARQRREGGARGGAEPDGVQAQGGGGASAEIDRGRSGAVFAWRRMRGRSRAARGGVGAWTPGLEGWPSG